MRISMIIPLFLPAALILGCGGNAAPNSVAPSADKSTSQSQQNTGNAVTKSIVPDINASGRRGEMARKMLNKSSNQFLQADTNRDYLISKQEAEQHLLHISKYFSRYDKNSDDHISWEEMLGHDKWPRPTH